MSKPSRRVREQAAELLSAAASNNYVVYPDAIGAGWSRAAWNLADKAYVVAERSLDPDGFGSSEYTSAAEAECLLRTGWSP